MPKTVDIKLHRLTCEFADNETGALTITGNLVVLAYDVESDIKETKVLYDFPNGPIRLRKAESEEINGEARMSMNAPSQDFPRKISSRLREVRWRTNTHRGQLAAAEIRRTNP